MKNDAIVIGGGVIGCSIALRLAAEGLSVAVIERNRLGCEASRAAAGMLSPQMEAPAPGAFFDLCLQSRRLYPGFVARLQELSGIDIEYNDSGTLRIIGGESDRAEVRGWLDWQAAAGLRFESLSGGELASIEPMVTGLATGAVFIPDDHQVENRRLMDALEMALKNSGVDVIQECEALEIMTTNGKATGVLTPLGRFDAGGVVVAAGSWSSSLLEPVGLGLKLIPARGQMLALRGDVDAIRRVIHTSKCYLVPRRDGRVLVGATIEYVGYNKAVTAAGMGSLLRAAVEAVEGLEKFEVVESWSGLRPDTPDHLPVLGATRVDNLWLATGHFRNGILLAPVTADLIAETIINGVTPEQAAPFGVERFETTLVAGQT